MKKNAFAVIVFIIIFLLLNFAIIFLVLKPKQAPTIQAPTSNVSATQYPLSPTVNPYNQEYLKAAKTNLEAIDKQRDGNGKYYGLLLKLSDGTIQPPVVDHRTALGVILGRYNYYLATKDQTQPTAIEKDLDLLLDDKLIPSLQNNLWNCKIMYRIWMDPSISQTIKEKAQKVCRKGLSIAEDLSENPLLKTDVPFKMVPEPDLTGIFSKTSKTLSSNESQMVSDKMIEYSGFTSEAVSLYLWENQDTNLKIAVSLFNLALEKYALLKTSDFVRGQCVPGIGALDLYITTKDNKYLDFAKNLYENSRLDTCLSDVYCKDNLFDKTTCAYFTQDLYRVTNDGKYKQTEETLLKSLMNSHSDNEDGLFYQVFIYPDLKKDIIKNIRDNGLAAGALSQKEN